MNTLRKKILLGLTTFGLTTFTPLSAMASCSYSSTAYIGGICYTAANFCPRDYLRADGQLVSISEYTTLFAVMGTTYGGNGITNFALPDLRGRVAVGQGKKPGLEERHQGTYFGQKEIVLTAEQLPSHSHEVNLQVYDTAPTIPTIDAKVPVSGEPGQITANSGQVVLAAAKSNAKYYTKAKPSGSVYMPVEPLTIDGNVNPGKLVGTTAPTAKATRPVQLSQSSLGLTACIAAEGVFPSRP